MAEIYHRKYQEIGERVAYYLERRGLSQAQLAECILCSTDFIEQIERYGSDVSCSNTSPWTGKSLDPLFAISDVLEVDFVVLFMPVSEEVFEQFRTDARKGSHERNIHSKKIRH